MDFAGMNYIAILVAAVAGFIIGGIWYGILANAWLSAIGKTKEELGSSFLPMLLAALANIFIAYVMAGLIGHLGENQVTLKNGVITAAFAWAGFVVTTIGTNYAFQGRPLKLALVDLGHWLAVFTVIGAVIGAFGVS